MISRRFIATVGKSVKITVNASFRFFWRNNSSVETYSHIQNHGTTRAARASWMKLANLCGCKCACIAASSAWASISSPTLWQLMTPHSPTPWSFWPSASAGVSWLFARCHQFHSRTKATSWHFRPRQRRTADRNYSAAAGSHSNPARKYWHVPGR